MSFLNIVKIYKNNLLFEQMSEDKEDKLNNQFKIMQFENDDDKEVEPKQKEQIEQNEQINERANRKRKDRYKEKQLNKFQAERIKINFLHQEKQKQDQNHQKQDNAHDYIQSTTKNKTKVIDPMLKDYNQHFQEELKEQNLEQSQQYLNQNSLAFQLLGSKQELHNKNYIGQQQVGSESIKMPKKQLFQEEVSFDSPNSPDKFINKKNKNKSLILDQVPLDRCLKLFLQKQVGFLVFHPIYHLYFSSDNKHLMSAKKTSSTIIPTFIISSTKEDFLQNGPNYLGKVKLKFMENIGNIFGPGLNPENADKNKIKPRQLLATVVYLNQFFSKQQKPRQFLVYLKKPQYSYYSLQGVKMYDEERSLEDLYSIEGNKDKIIVFRNRPPVWKQQIKGHSLNFRGRVNLPSIKNFILEVNDENNKEQTEEVLLFGKAHESKYNMDVSNPLNPLISFGIALTAFGPS